MPITTYFIGGIATDKQLFEHQLQHIPNSIYLPFPTHNDGDTMETYVLKFLPSINQSERFNMVGYSMGGIMTMELLKHLQPEKVILIASVKCRKEMPWQLRQLRHTRLHYLFSGKLFIKSTILGSRFLKEFIDNPKARDKVVSMVKNNTPAFLHWCVNAIAQWNGGLPQHKNIIHLHGDKDKMFPIKNIKNALIIKGATHNIILTKPAAITELIIQYLS